MDKVKLADQELETWAGLLSFELNWWKDRGWMNAKSFKDLANRPVPEGFDLRRRLLNSSPTLPERN
jgi:hypothetical protein